MISVRLLRQSARPWHTISRSFHAGFVSFQKETEIDKEQPDEEDAPRLTREQVNELYQHYDPTKFRDEVKISMPDLGDTGDGTILKWNKVPGDYIEKYAVLCEIQTDAFSFFLQTEDEEVGYLEEICVPAGTSNIPKGHLLARILLWTDDPPEKPGKVVDS